MDETCELTDLPTAMCACPDHRGGTEPTQLSLDELETLGSSITARYDGYCPACRKAIYAGDRIAKLADGQGWIHEQPCQKR